MVSGLRELTDMRDQSMSKVRSILKKGLEDEREVCGAATAKTKCGVRLSKGGLMVDEH